MDNQPPQNPTPTPPTQPPSSQQTPGDEPRWAHTGDFTRTTRNYSDIPVYKKMWFLILLLVLLAPVGLILILVHKDLYRQYKGVAYSISPKVRKLWIFIFILLSITAILRIIRLFIEQ
ncbi:MAG TPA: hypothetical protein VFT87_05730 [Candidatus Saccharimonadales bacterium]|nr:hypothetical protein [Candidatus Saccharimonadales bacterium]